MGEKTPTVPTDAIKPSLFESPEQLANAKSTAQEGDSYFPAYDASSGPKSPTQVAAGAKTPAEILRRLSLVDTDRPATPEAAPREKHPTLNLSGNLISAALCIPYYLRFREGRWSPLEYRRGSSALYDAFSYLSGKHSSWNHTLVAWTGEIKPPEPVFSPPGSRDGSFSSASRTNGSFSRLRQDSLPVPVNPNHKPAPPKLPPGAVQLSSRDRKRLEEELLGAERGRVVPVWLFDGQDEGQDEIVFTDQTRWRRFAEHAIFTTFHYKTFDSSAFPDATRYWTDYVRMNQKFADRIMEIYKPGDVVWVHDYHLMLLPSILRQRRPDMYVGFHLQIPFPSSEYVRCISKRKELLMGMLGANMIGFQTYNYSRHFASCCKRILHFDAEPVGVDAHGAHIAVDVFPIGIDAGRVARIAFSRSSIEEAVRGIRQRLPGIKIIVGRDRLDTVRGVAQKMQAFEKFLEEYPEWRGKVVLVQVTSQTSIEEEKEDEGHKIAHKVSELVQRINGTYGSLAFQPVRHFPKYLTEDEYFALLRVADVGLITSVRDGMNTTSFEYVLCQKEGKGPLILSEFSGTASSLQDALTINPWDLKGVAGAINEALTMPREEKARRYDALYKHVTRQTVQEWTRTYLARLLVNLASVNPAANTPLLDRHKLRACYKRAKKRLFMFDYDGTLTPIVRDPQAAVPSDRILRTVKTLAEDRRNRVWIISGRDQEFLDAWMGHIPELGLSAEHGSFVRPPARSGASSASAPSSPTSPLSAPSGGDGAGALPGWTNLAAATDMTWQREVLAAFTHYTERTPGSFVERKRIAITWHFRRADPEFGAHQAVECKKHLETTVGARFPVEVMNGKANLEVRPRFLNKGEIASRLVKEFGAKGPDFVFCAGDDFTDEDMFKALAESELPEEIVFPVTVSHSSKMTLARWCLLEPADVVATVALLNGSVSLEDLAAAGAGTEKLKF